MAKATTYIIVNLAINLCPSNTYLLANIAIISDIINPDTFRFVLFEKHISLNNTPTGNTKRKTIASPIKSLFKKQARIKDTRIDSDILNGYLLNKFFGISNILFINSCIFLFSLYSYYFLSNDQIDNLLHYNHFHYYLFDKDDNKFF